MEKIPITKEKAYTFSGYFNIKETFNHVQKYLEETKFYDPGVKDHVEKNVGGKKELTSVIEAEKVFSDRYKIFLKYQFIMSGKDEEVKLNNKVVKLTHGSAKIIVNSYIEADWRAARDKGTLHNFLSRVYDKFIGRDEQVKAMIQAGKDASDLIARFKEHMNAIVK